MMPRINLAAIATAGFAAFVVGALWYGLLFGDLYLRLLGAAPAADGEAPFPAWLMAVEFGRCLIVAFALAALFAMVEALNWRGGLLVTLIAWLGFQAMMLAGSALHEAYPVALAALHAADALAKDLTIASVLLAWPRRRAASAPVSSMNDPDRH